MSSSTRMVCFNSSCKEVSDNWRRGWRRRTGEYANLCDRCGSAYEDGKFCDTFHLNASGWRCCESCGKQIHCGCIVSFHMFVLLDAGGIECLSCAKKSYILTPNPAWPPPSQFLPSQPERMKDLSAKTWSGIAGSGPVPWRQAPSLFNGPNIQSDVLPKSPFDINVSGSVNRICGCERLCDALPEAKQERLCERLVINRKLGLGPPETLQNGISGLFRKEQSHFSVNDFSLMSPPKNSSTNHNLATASSSKIETDVAQLSGILPQPSISVCMGKQVCDQNGMDSSTDPQIRSGKARADGRGRNYLLTRYRPQITDEELQQISSDSKSVITPLFEKMLSASDAGKIGRLVLPKKCAEAYFPYISQPEGLPLNVQDVKGNEWVFQFRFWPNNNSRMYVLEGITPCIQSLQLQAGDVVTFSRLEPEGKLVMGGRKSSANPSSDQVWPPIGDEVTVSNALTSQDGNTRNNSAEVISTNGQMKGRSSSSTHPINQDDKLGTGNTCSELDKSGFSAKKILEVEPVIHGKRKNSNLGVKSKRVRIENVDLLDLKITFKEAQVLMRSPAKLVPSVSLVEGCEFEEFEGTAPVVGRPTILAIDHSGEKIQWVQCEDCFKWRKVPADALLSSRWICSENAWDLDRSLCSAPEELTLEQLEDMLPSMNKVASGKKEITEQDEYVSMALEGLDTLANLAIQGEGGSLTSSSDTRTKHPRHKPGCTCIVCLQPPSGSKHEQPCDCVACTSLKRRFKTLMERREKRQLDKLAECASQGTQPEDVQDIIDAGNSSSLNIDEPPSETQASPLKGQIIDLNIQPEREDELSPGSESVGRVFKQQCTFGASDVVENVLRKQMQQDGIVGGPSFVTCMALDRVGHGKTS